MSGRSTARDVFELMIDREEQVFPVTQLNVPVELVAAGADHAFYLASVVVLEPAVTECAEGGLGAVVEYGFATILFNGQRIQSLRVVNNGPSILTVHVRVFRVRGLSDT